MWAGRDWSSRPRARRLLVRAQKPARKGGAPQGREAQSCSGCICPPSYALHPALGPSGGKVGSPNPGSLPGTTPGRSSRLHRSDFFTHHVSIRKIRSLCFLKADHPGPLCVPGRHWAKPPALLLPGEHSRGFRGLQVPFRWGYPFLASGCVPKVPAHPPPGFLQLHLALQELWPKLPHCLRHRLPLSARPVKPDEACLPHLLP